LGGEISKKEGFSARRVAKGDPVNEAVSKPVPLAPNVRYMLCWRLSEKGMDLSANGRVFFAEARKYDLSGRKPVSVGTGDSTIAVKSLIVRRLP
jgi:hypothetical protein